MRSPMKRKSTMSIAFAALVSIGSICPQCLHSQEVPEALSELMDEVREASDKQAKIMSLWGNYSGGGLEQGLAEVNGQSSLEFIEGKISEERYSFYGQVKQGQSELIATESERINVIATYGLLGALALYDERSSDAVARLIYDPNFSGTLSKRDVVVCLIAGDLRKQVRPVGALTGAELQKWTLAAESSNPKDRIVAYLLFRSCAATDAQKVEFYSKLGKETSIPILRIGLLSLIEEGLSDAEDVIAVIGANHDSEGRAMHSEVVDEYKTSE